MYHSAPYVSAFKVPIAISDEGMHREMCKDQGSAKKVSYAYLYSISIIKALM